MSPCVEPTIGTSARRRENSTRHGWISAEEFDCQHPPLEQLRSIEALDMAFGPEANHGAPADHDGPGPHPLRAPDGDGLLGSPDGEPR